MAGKIRRGLNISQSDADLYGSPVNTWVFDVCLPHFLTFLTSPLEDMHSHLHASCDGAGVYSEVLPPNNNGISGLGVLFQAGT